MFLLGMVAGVIVTVAIAAVLASIKVSGGERDEQQDKNAR